MNIASNKITCQRNRVKEEEKKNNNIEKKAHPTHKCMAVGTCVRFTRKKLQKDEI